VALREELIVDFQKANAALRDFERSAQSAVGDIELDVDTRQVEQATRELRTMDQRLDDVDAGVNEVNAELSEMELAARRSTTDFKQLADAMGVSEDEARRMSQEILESSNSARRLEQAAREVAEQMGLSEDQARDFARQVRSAGDEAETGQDRFRGLNDQLARLATFATVALVFREIAQGIREAITEAAAFDDALTGSLAIQGDVAALRDDFQSLAFEISESVRFSATEAAEAFFFLASAGLDAEQQLAALPAVAQFAQAGMFDLATATDLLTDAQSALGLTVSDAEQNFENLTRVADVLVRANVLANASVQQFSEALTNRAATAARQVGVEIEEVVAVLAAFADQGIKGQRAGEAISIVLRDLQKAAVDNAEAFSQLGVTVFDQEGEFVSFAGIIGDLEQALAGLSDEQRRVTLTSLGFQEQSLANLNTLIGTSDQIRRYEAGLRAAGGTTEEVANNQLRSLGAALDIAGNKVDNLQVQFGTALAPAVQFFAEDVLPALLDGLAIAIPRIEEFADAIAGTAAATDEAGVGLQGWTSAVILTGGIVADAIGAIGDATKGLVELVNADLEGFTDQLADLNRRAQNTRIAFGLQGISTDLEAGRAPADAFGESLAFVFSALEDVKNGSELTERSIFQFASATGLSRAQLAEILPLILGQAEALGANREELDAILRITRNLRGSPLNFDRGGLGQLRRDAAALDDTFRDFTEPEVIDRLRRDADDAAISVAELVISSEDLAIAFSEGVPAIEQAVVIIDGLRTGAIEAADVISETLGAAITDVSDAFIDANKDNQVSGQEFLTGLIQTQSDLIRFRANILALSADFPALAVALLSAGADTAATAAADLVANIELADDAESVLQGQNAELAQLFEDTFFSAVDLTDLDGPALQMIEALGRSFADPTLTPILQAWVDQQLARLRFGFGFDLLGGPNVGLPTTSTTSGGDTIPVGPNEGLPIQQNITIVNPTTQDLTSDAQTAAQLLGQVGSSLVGQAG